ncbi:hypothetical protein L6248_01080 [Candidatus Parcubacteria bacterium]|nr:hypothetical protein [Candidatus Parcubacteria bacterium]
MKFRLKDKWDLVSSLFVAFFGVAALFLVGIFYQVKNNFIRNKGQWYFAVFIFAAMILLITILLI